MDEISEKQLFGMFGEQVHGKIREKLDLEMVHGMIVFECVDTCSSNLGRRTAVTYGPGGTIPTLKSANGKWLGDLPSQRQHARWYYVKPTAQEKQDDLHLSTGGVSPL